MRAITRRYFQLNSNKLNNMKTLKKHLPAVLALSIGMSAGVVQGQVTLFSDDFTTDTSANWIIRAGSGDNVDDYTAEFGFNYATNQFVRNGVTNTIPLSPNGTVGSATNGVKITVNNNDEIPATSGVSLYPVGQSFADDYALKFDIWINYNGGEGGGTGSTEFGTFGINMLTDNASWAFGTNGGIWFAATGEGGANRDWRAYAGDNFAPPVADLELTGLSGGFLDRDNDGTPEQERFTEPSTAPLKLMFPKPQFETDGVPGKQWVQMEVRQRTNELGQHIITWLADGYIIAQHAQADVFGWTQGNIMIGAMDPFSSIANPREQNFVIFDNVRVQDVTGVEDISVSIVATQPNAAEPATDGEVTITRTGSTANALVVPFRTTGSATRGADYVLQTNGVTVTANAVTIPSGSDSVVVTVKVQDDSIGEPTEQAYIVLAGNPAAYDIGLNAYAIVEIADDGDVPGATVVAAKAFAYEPNAVNPARIEVRFGNATFQTVTVNYTVSGTAVAGTDYVTLPGSVTINAGETVGAIPIVPIDNAIIDGNRTVIVTLASGTGYVLGATTNATATIRDDDTLPSGTLVFSANFESEDSVNDWTVNLGGGRTDHTATFGYDYSADGIPPAPGSAGTTKGLKLTANETGGVFGGLSVSPTGQGFTGNYLLRFDMWINYNGPLPTGGSGSSEIGGGGILSSGTVPESAGSGNGVFFAVSGDGGVAADYRVYFRGSLQGTAAANTTYLAGSSANTASYYAIFGGDTAPAAQNAASPTTQTGATGAGNGGFAWRDMVVLKEGTEVKWFMDNLHIATYNTTTNQMSTNICLVYFDPAGGVSPFPQFSFGLFDNVRVEALAASTPPVITAIAVVGGDVQIDFEGEVSDTPASFLLTSAGTVDGTYGDVSAIITELSPGNFRAVRALAGPQQFYRIRRQ
jgi:hypothetical protein